MCSWVTADLATGIFHIYADNRLCADDDGSVFVCFKQTKSPFFKYQGLIVCEVVLLVFGFCFICSAFVVDVQAMVYHFCSLQMLLVHIVKSIRWVIESSHNADLFVVPKRGCPIFRVKGLYRTVRQLDMRLLNLETGLGLHQLFRIKVKVKVSMPQGAFEWRLSKSLSVDLTSGS